MGAWNSTFVRKCLQNMVLGPNLHFWMLIFGQGDFLVIF